MPDTTAPDTTAPDTTAPDTTAVEPQPEIAVEVQEVQLPQPQDRSPRPAAGQMDLLLDVTVKVQACLGEVETQVRDLLQINTGSVITLDRQVGEPVDLYLRGTRFATGHLVVVGDHLGVRIKEILQPAPADQPEAGNPA
jgi:flagellar motor switch protein FliN/FliY